RRRWRAICQEDGSSEIVGSGRMRSVPYIDPGSHPTDSRLHCTEGTRKKVNFPCWSSSIHPPLMVRATAAQTRARRNTGASALESRITERVPFAHCQAQKWTAGDARELVKIRIE